MSYYQWELWLIVPLLLATAIANTVLVVRWVSPYAIVPDSKPTDEEASDFRRLAAGVFAISLVGVLIPFLRSPRRLPTAATLKPQKRFRKKAPPEVKASALAQGFYRNPLSGGLHYVLPAVRAGSWVPARHTRSKRRRKPLIRLERRYRHALVAEWYASGAGLKSYPRQERSKERSPSRPIRPAMARPARFWRMLEMPRTSLMHVPLMDVFKPFEVPAHPPSRPKSITRRLEPSDMVFALEQESLRLVREGRVDEACQFLFRVLEQRDRWSRSLLRLFDLFAIITVTRQRPQLLDALIHLVELELSPKQTDETSKEPVPRMTAARFPELAQRVQSWKNPNSNWRRRWSKKSNWTGLPM